MTLNASGPISLAGTTAGQSIEIENGGNGTTQISLNCTAVRNLAGVPSGAITMPTNFYGKSNRVVANITIGSNTANYTLNTAKVSGYSAGKTCVNLTINSGVYVNSGSTGSYAFVVGSCFASGDVIKITNNGTILGRGGNGGTGCSYFNSNNKPAPPGSSGGPALQVNFPTTVKNSGRIAAGGGGGGGGGNAGQGGCFPGYQGGGGGGGGIGCGSGGGNNTGPSCSYGSSGGSGTLTSAGSGGGGSAPAGPGGPGGGYGSSGSSGSPRSSGCGGIGGGGGGTGTAINGVSKVTYCGPSGTINGPTNG